MASSDLSGCLSLPPPTSLCMGRVLVFSGVMPGWANETKGPLDYCARFFANWYMSAGGFPFGSLLKPPKKEVPRKKKLSLVQLPAVQLPLACQLLPGLHGCVLFFGVLTTTILGSPIFLIHTQVHKPVNKKHPRSTEATVQSRAQKAFAKVS